MKWKSILAIVVIATPSTAFADVNCRFTIASLSMTDDGWISASFNGTGFTKSWWLCSMGGAVTLSDGFGTRNITGEICRTLYSQMLTAKATNRPIYFLFNGPSACTAAALCA